MALILGIAVGLTLTLDSVVWGLLAVAVLVASTSRYLFPTDYELNDRGITEVHLGRRRDTEWSRVGRVVDQNDGIFLGPFRTPSRLDSFRGWFLRYPSDALTRERVDRMVRGKALENR